MSETIFSPNMTDNAIKRQETLGLHVAFQSRKRKGLTGQYSLGVKAMHRSKRFLAVLEEFTATNEQGNAIDENIYRLKFAELEILINK